MIEHNRRQASVPGGTMDFLLQLIHYAPFAIALGCFAGCLVIELQQIPISKEGRDQFYSTFGSVSFYCSILLSTQYGRKYRLSWVKSLIFSYLTFRLLFSLTSVLWTQLDIAMFGNGTVASFRSIMFLPLLCWIFSKFCKEDILNLCDFLTPYFMFNHGNVTLACWIEGCCAGRVCSWGLLNPLTGMRQFPTQPCIILLSLAVAWWGLSYSKKHTYKTNGMVFANSLCLYGIFRYFIELFSDDPRIVWVLSWLSICSLAMIAQGFVVRYLVGKRTKKS